MSDAKPSWRSGWRLALLVGAGLTLIFGVGEVGMRLAYPVDAASLPALLATPAEGATTDDGRPIFRGASDLMAPHLDGVFRDHDYRSDAIGFRGPERSRMPAPGTRRVIVTGDSIAMGSGVDEAESFPAVAEAWLEHHASPPEWEVLNAGMAGANVSLALGRLQKGIHYYGADVYVYSFSPNDIEGPRYQRFPAERTAIDLIREAGWPARSESALIRVSTWWWLDLWGRIQALNLEHYAHEIQYNYFENPPAWGALLDGLDRLARMAEVRDRCAIVLVLTRLVELDAETHPFVEIYDAVSAEARVRGLHVVETQSLFFGRDPDTVRHSPLDPHPNAAGHALIGERLGEAIAALPATCFEP